MFVGRLAIFGEIAVAARCLCGYPCWMSYLAIWLKQKSQSRISELLKTRGVSAWGVPSVTIGLHRYNIQQWIFAISPVAILRTPSSNPLIILPMPIWNANGSCPKAFVLKETVASLPFVLYPGLMKNGGTTDNWAYQRKMKNEEAVV